MTTNLHSDIPRDIPNPAGNGTRELLTFAQAAQALGVGVLDIRRMVRTEQCPTVLDSRCRKRIPAAWVADPAGWLR